MSIPFKTLARAPVPTNQPAVISDVQAGEDFRKAKKAARKAKKLENLKAAREDKERRRQAHVASAVAAAERRKNASHTVEQAFTEDRDGVISTLEFFNRASQRTGRSYLGLLSELLKGKVSL